MVDIMRKFSLVLALCLFGTYALATPPVYGPLQAQNNLDDVDSASTSLANLGGAPLASPTFTGTVTIPSGSVLNTPASINLTNATGIPYSGLPSLAANQLLGSLTATTPSGQSVPSCSAETDSLLWTSGVGFSCNTSINAGKLGGATFASPGAIGSTTASSGAFTTLQATSTVTGIGLIGVQSFTSSGTYTPDAQTQAIIVEVQAQGGGGGGCASTSSTQNCVAGSGIGGSYAEVYYSSAVTETVTIGTSGAGGSAGNNNGTAGSTASFGALVSCPGGVAGLGGSAQTDTNFAQVGPISGAQGGCSISGGTTIKNTGGASPGAGIMLTGLGNVYSAPGGNSMMGVGASLAVGNSAGGNAQGNGGGGSGATSANGPAQAGGNPSGGRIVVYEYN